MSNIRAALVGNPNSGKTTFFNQLTGARQHVGNYPGVTVEQIGGECCFMDTDFSITDLPGIYSISAYSEEEIIARDFMMNENPDVVINIIDSSNLERNLYLTLQLLEMGYNMVIAANMVDLAKDRGMEIDFKKLSKVLNVPIVPIIARTGWGKKELLETAINVYNLSKNNNQQKSRITISYGDDIENALIEIEKIITAENFNLYNMPPRWIALKYLEQDRLITDIGDKHNKVISEKIKIIVIASVNHIKTTLDTYPEASIADYRYGFISSIMKDNIIKRSYDYTRVYTSEKIDRVVTHRFLGPIFMLVIIFLVYKFTFWAGEYPVILLEKVFSLLSSLIAPLLGDGYLKSLIISGIIDGVGGVLGFVPIIMLMFFAIAILEDSGYLARIAYMMDKIFSQFGLHGNSVMAYIISGGIAGGCAVPGIMATRTLKSKNEKLATIITAPFMSCGAKIPIYAVIVSAFFENSKSLVLFIITLISWTGALIVAKFLRSTVLRGENAAFVMELPPYRYPTFKGLLIHSWERTWEYIKKAGTIILAISIIIWAFMTFPGLSVEDEKFFANEKTTVTSKYNQNILDELGQDNNELSENAKLLQKELTLLDNSYNEQKLKSSFAGITGRAIENVTSLAGFDWKTNIALIGGVAAKEVIVSTMSTAYSLGNSEDTGSLSEVLKKDKSWTAAKSWSLLVFIIFYSPCFATIIMIVRETKSVYWGLFSFAFNTTIAFVLAVGVYQIMSFFC